MVTRTSLVRVDKYPLRTDRIGFGRSLIFTKESKIPMAILPLEDLVVLEFSHTVMGPSCGVVLADLGADVIRVEPAPDGDRTRRLHGFATGFFAYFNRNKRCICIDAKSPDGLAVANDLVRKADVTTSCARPMC
jgi:crotonobetainyl-CoA:carnitine CoA-transferase CaiB-like acyl-CoA transferase